MIHRNPNTPFCRSEYSPEVDSLPKVTENYPLKSLNEAVVRVNTDLAAGYKKTRWS
jgi:hypothetical protein